MEHKYITPKIIDCKFTSEWDDGSVVTTPCKYNPTTGHCEPEVACGTIPTGMVEREYITLNGGTIEVCPDCHEYIMEVDYDESSRCANSECMG